jgi:hypothetical protein
MEHVSVQDNNIATIGHDRETAIMQTLFRRGGLYEYERVSFDEFEAILNPGQVDEFRIGKAFDRIIKRGGKPYRKLESKEALEAAVLGARIPDEPAKVVTIDGERERTVVDKLVDAFTIEEAAEEVEQVAKKSTDLTTQAQAALVNDPPSQEAASALLLTVAQMRREIADTFQPMKEAAHRAHKVICDQERNVDAPLAQAEATLKNRIGAFVQEQRRLAFVEEQRLRDQEAERARQEADKAAIDQAIDQAVDLEARGDVKAAEAVLASPAPVPVRYVAPAPVAPAVAQVKGVSTRLEWDFRILDINQIPREYLLVNESAIRTLGKTTQGRARIAGVEFFEKPVVAASRRG